MNETPRDADAFGFYGFKALGPVLREDASEAQACRS
jgi:hypothetical protein